MAIDLHLHSNVSDGTFSPTQVVEYAHSIGLKCISLTDHDSVDGIPEAQQRARELDLPFIPGIEMTTLHRGNEIHVLGYFINHECPRLASTLKAIHERIERRIKAILEKLVALDYQVTFDEVKEASGRGTLGRPHIARVMFNKGYIQNHQEAFDNFIGEGKPAYVEVEDALSPEQAYHIITECGGIASIAHPGYLGRTKMLHDDDIFNHRIWGARAVEVFHTKHDTYMVNYYLSLARKYDLAVTGGSDCHGNFYPTILMERKMVPDWVAEKFIEYCQKIKGDLDINLKL